MADKNTGELAPEVYGLQNEQSTADISFQNFGGFMNYIGAYYSNKAFYINILGLQGAVPVNDGRYNDSAGGSLKLVENKWNEYNDTIIIRYYVPDLYHDKEGKEIELVTVEKTDEETKEGGALIEEGGPSRTVYTENKWAGKITSAVLNTWKTKWLSKGPHIHILRGSVDPGKGSQHVSFGQHAFKTGIHKGYCALKPSTKKRDRTYGYERKMEKTGYTEGDYLEYGSGTDIHMGGTGTNINTWSTGCIIIWGGNSERYWLFMLTVYMHGWYPGVGKETNIPVTVWRGVDYFKWKTKRQQQLGRAGGSLAESQVLPELHFGTYDPKKVKISNWRTDTGWVERMQRVLWEGSGKSVGETPPFEWGVFDKQTVNLLRDFQDNAIINLNAVDKTIH
jgi:hypothetical protein